MLQLIIITTLKILIIIVIVFQMYRILLNKITLLGVLELRNLEFYFLQIYLSYIFKLKLSKVVIFTQLNP